jgi:thymidylate kinase
MRIVISGTQGVGKTTLFNKIIQDKLYQDYTRVKEMVRHYINIGVTGYIINQDANEVSQLLNMKSAIINLMDNKKAIYDRSIMDVLVYSMYLYSAGKMKKEVLREIMQLHGQFDRLIDIKVLIDVNTEASIVDDGVRATDIEYRNAIASLFRTHAKVHGYTIIQGNEEEVLEQFNEIALARGIVCK